MPFSAQKSQFLRKSCERCVMPGAALSKVLCAALASQKAVV